MPANTLSLPSPLQHQPCLPAPPSPANQPRGPWAKAVHEDPQRQGRGAEHEGADGEAQVEHLFLAVTAQPLPLLILGGVGGVLSWGGKGGLST